MVLRSTGFSVRGRVMAATRPLAGASVHVDGLPAITAQSDAEGRFTVAGLRRGHYQLRADLPHFRFPPVPLDLGAGGTSLTAVSAPDFFAQECVFFLLLVFQVSII
jgi:hypothetical protein